MEWTVIGGGPAGIAAVGKLIDAGVDPAKIGWIDPHFQVGDLGKKWSQVPGNTKVELFNRYFEHCQAFAFKSRPKKFKMEEIDPNETCLLQYVVEPLQWVTDHLRKKVHAKEEMALELFLEKGGWEIKLQKGSIFSKNVILAIGSDPKALFHPGPETIGLEVALDPNKLQKAIQSNDTVAVFGSSHSAVLVLAKLLETPVKKVINFYRSPIRYAVHLKDWILYDDTGLKGFTAQWSKKYLDGELPPRLERMLANDPAFEESLSTCTKAIYAVGFERRKLPILKQYEHLHYDDKTGIIAPGLFGIGIAFPRGKFSPLGHLEYSVGLWKFMDQLNLMLPFWQKYANA
ncbi:MAG: NAD(P)-binding domain-containing protein [Parachlamydiales bacterium]|nr:NAD(P)-binding domain-containing protein [Parachlamydiales bacterium]